MTDTNNSKGARRDYERKLRRAEANVQSQIVEAARQRVPDVSTPPFLPVSSARKYLSAARAEFSRSKNRHLNRATRRDLAKGICLA